jgi:inosose dehydratase
MSNAASGGASSSGILDRLAAGPISWGVCEVPGWGLQLEPDRALAEMRSLGIVATEAGPDGYLGTDPTAVRALLERHGLGLVGGFLPVVLHEPAKLDSSLAKVRRAAELFAELGAQFICSAAVVDDDWSPRRDLDEREWQHLLNGLRLVDEATADYGVRQVLHPHWRTLVEQDEDVRRVLDGSGVQICLDTGHLALGGTDALELARSHPDRVAHVHLKDVRTGIAARLREGELDLVGAVQAGLFQPLGAGDVPVDEVVRALEQSGYAGWYVLEQDTAILGEAPPPGEGPIDDVRRSIEFLHGIVQTAATPRTAAAMEGR